ncbi:uncharacterized protein KRP23_2109 [Phytophthora ramorum]|uniref:uncharacterized protein n=1 Tax=Phytophthora ramorum TaxID=164328 RepID=UPI0030A46ACC|nr:hypothetical protein KRP23_2109 [Phytophthora ramorum]
MRTRIWEDAAAMSVVSVLGFIMNEDGAVEGSERTQVLCKLMPSIHTLSHRAILALLVTQLSDADAQVFYAEGGLKVLNAWLVDGVARREAGLSKEKKRTEMFSQVRALLRILDVNVQTDAVRKQNSYLTSTFAKVIELLDNAGPDYAAEGSRLNIYRRHFESSCGVPSSVKDGRSEPRRTASSYANGSSSRNSKSTGDSSSQSSFISSSTATTTSTSTASTPRKATSSASSSTATSSTSSSSTTTSSHRIPPSSVLQYQPKSFLQKDGGPNNQGQDDLEEYMEDDDDEGVITNVNQGALSASLEQKIRGNGHDMQYGERSPCRKCKRMVSKRCTHCEFCAKCGQKEKCEPISVSPAMSSPSGDGEKTAGNGVGGKSLSVKDRNVQVLGSVMDAAIYHAFRQEDFHSVFSLIQNGMDVNFQRVESDHSTALMAAAHHGRDDAASRLLSLGANPCLEDHIHNKAWNFAERRGHTELMEKLKKCCEEWELKHKDANAEMQP